MCRYTAYTHTYRQVDLLCTYIKKEKSQRYRSVPILRVSRVVLRLFNLKSLWRREEVKLASNTILSGRVNTGGVLCYPVKHLISRESRPPSTAVTRGFHVFSKIREKPTRTQCSHINQEPWIKSALKTHGHRPQTCSSSTGPRPLQVTLNITL